MRSKPTLRIPLGVLALVIALIVYAGVILWAAQWIGQLHILLQTPIYLVLGTVWIMPLRGYLKWMETGRWR